MSAPLARPEHIPILIEFYKCDSLACYWVLACVGSMKIVRYDFWLGLKEFESQRELNLDLPLSGITGVRLYYSSYHRSEQAGLDISPVCYERYTNTLS